MRTMTDGERDPAEWIFGERLRAAMKERGWSEREMARRAKVSPQTIANMLLGYKAQRPDEPWRPTQQKVGDVARALEEDPAGWLRDAGYHVPERATVDPEQADRLARKIAYVEAGDATALERLIDSLLRARGYIAADAPGPGSGAEGVPVVVSHEGESTTQVVESGEGEFVPDEVPSREAADHQGP